MSFFDEIESLASDAIDCTYGDEILIIRTQRGEFFTDSEVNDAYVIVGIVDLNPMVIQVQDKSQYDGFQPDVSGQKVHVSIDLDEFSSKEDHPDQHDILKVKNGPRKGSYKISARPQNDGAGRILCVCVPE